MRRNRDFGIKQNNGPLMTDHLRDLDIELELLKRKREILQQEQNMISRIARQNYEQPSSSFRHEHIQFQPQQVDVANFSNLYEAQGGTRNFRNNLKRQNQSNWQAPNPPKRFNAPRAVNPWQNDSVQGQRKAFQPPKSSFSPVPLMSVKPGISQRLKRENPNRRDFQPSKITKSRPKKDNQPKARAQNVKIVNHQANEAKNLVSETMKSLEPRNDDHILHPDKQPSLQMKGRLELALGSILKELRLELSSDPDVSEYFATHYIQRIVKRTIRSRIRDVMMGKAVGTINDILDNYRGAYPKETDLDIIKTVKEAQAYSSKNLSVTHLIESDDPQDFFRKNMTRILSNKLDDLFSNLESFYENKDKEIIESINKLPEPDKSANTNDTDDYSEKVNLQHILNNFFESVPDDNELVKALGGRIDKAKHYIDFMDRLIEQRLPKVLPKFKDMILNILYHDRDFIGAKAMVMTEMKKKGNTTDESVQQKGNDDGITEDAEKNENKSVEPSRDTAIDKTTNTTGTTTNDGIYYVKLVGRPKLPARAEICEFLNQFNTNSIKKHKTINNLLVLSFTNKDDYNRILASNETVIGDATLIIKASEQVVSNKAVNQSSTEKKCESQNTSDKKEETVNSSYNEALDDSFISNDLDNQINSLLSSIRQADEEDCSKSDNLNENDDVSIEKSAEVTDKTRASDEVDDNNVEDKVNDDISDHNRKADDENDCGDDKPAADKVECTDNADVTREDLTEKSNIGEQNVEKIDEKDNTEMETACTETTGSGTADTIDEEKDMSTKRSGTDDTNVLNVENNKNEELKSKVPGRSTPTRFSSRLARTPSTVTTRRASKLAQNNP
ncbi:uncharacterized protein LOC133319737 [Danaus plexippus]|uniref:uncharacterized protein LOC133319737 n=1 Tax=Danaus plexippus TaxID=13037 RepID=UPI002AAF56A8|nr:uncharacterized protein LOC133319737 [Danaus plexippus]